jgi:hypothetical protein
MGLTMSQRQAVTTQTARRYRSASTTDKTTILDELCALTGWHRDHARKALRTALTPPTPRRPRAPRDPVYSPETITALRTVWAILDAPCGKRLAPFLPEIVDRLTACGELALTDEVRYQLTHMSAATIDRHLAADRARWRPHGRARTKPGSLLKSQIPIRTWADWDDARPGFVEIDLVSHDGGNATGEHAWTLTVTDIATGWTENRAVRNKAEVWVLAALDTIVAGFPFPVLGIDSDNGSEFINAHLLTYCRDNEITFTRARPGHKNDGAHVEQKNWTVVRQTVGYHRYTGETQLDLRGGIYSLLRHQINFFSPQQKLISKTRHGATVSKKHDTARTPYQRTLTDPTVDVVDTDALRETYLRLNPVAIRREIIALSDALAHEVITPDLARLATALAHAGISREATTSPKRAS